MSFTASLFATRKLTLIALATAGFSAGLAAQGPTPSTPPAAKTPPIPPTVYVNPRSDSSDPRVGLKGGLYDAATAIQGMELVLTTPKPAGFAPDVDTIKAVDATPPPPPVVSWPSHVRSVMSKGIMSATAVVVLFGHRPVEATGAAGVVFAPASPWKIWMRPAPPAADAIRIAIIY